MQSVLGCLGNIASFNPHTALACPEPTDWSKSLVRKLNTSMLVKKRESLTAFLQNKVLGSLLTPSCNFPAAALPCSLLV